MYLGNVDSVQIENDENGFELHLSTDEFGPIVVNIQSECETLYDQVKARIGPYLQERDEARSAVAAGVSLKAFLCEPNESAGMAEVYDISDPKHPDWHSVHADIWDNRDKTAGV